MKQSSTKSSKKPLKRALPGRPTKYKPEYSIQAKELCLLGVTDKILAEFFEVNEDTILDWKKKFPAFAAALKEGKLIADAKVAASLHKRALGFSYDEVTFEKVLPGDQQKKDIKKGLYQKKVVTKMVVPDTGAAMNWLKNRQKELWRDNIEIDFNKMSDEQLDKIIEKLTSKANQIS